MASINGTLQEIIGYDDFDLDFIGGKYTAGIAENAGNHSLTPSGSFPRAMSVMTKPPGTGFENSVADSGGLSGGYIEIKFVILFHKINSFTAVKIAISTIK